MTLLAVLSQLTLVDELLPPVPDAVVEPSLHHRAASLPMAYFFTEVAQDCFAVFLHDALLATLLALHRGASNSHVSYLSTPFIDSNRDILDDARWVVVYCLVLRTVGKLPYVDLM